MQRRKFILGIIIVLAMVIIIGTYRSLNNRAAQEPGPSRMAEMNPILPKEPESWAHGTYTLLAGINLRAELDRHLMLDLRCEMPSTADESLRAKLTAFLHAYSKTEFARYLDFRPASGMCAIDDPRLQSMLKSWSPQLGPTPTDPIEVIASAWRMYISEGMGPIRPGPLFDAVKWPSCRVTVRRIAPREIVPQEWDETSPGEGLLIKEYAATTSMHEIPLSMRPVVPNRITVLKLAQRDDGVLYADFEMVCRTAQTPPRRLVLRLIWEAGDNDWLPLHALSFGGDPSKPFLW